MRRLLSLFVASVAVLVAPSAAFGELVVMRGGDVLKVASFEVVGEKVRLALGSGGRLVLPISRVERIVDDEVVPEEAPPVPVDPGILVRFAESSPPPTPFGAEILAAARRHGVSAQLVAAVVRAESAFDPRAVSHKGASGLMQLMPATAERFGVRRDEVFDPVRNLDGGTRYLRWLLDRFDDDPALVLAAYNAGEGTVQRYGGVPPYRETRHYVKKILTSLGAPPVEVASATVAR